MAIKIEENNSSTLSENLLINYNEIFKLDSIPQAQFKFIGITNYMEFN